ncbi:calmodulin-binding receptor-like cytoplasmic kinase 2 isoform X2 [Typha latifolia]|uniref:calmodulin-binding receptor-like cytoplasmic kinase 2 isoform X2 n=1 Tax=Typha latifolia TaxID=4733 RepID=UPI003C2CB119
MPPLTDDRKFNSSGRRRSSSGRRPFSVSGRTPDRWDFSRSSGVSTASSVSAVSSASGVSTARTKSSISYRSWLVEFLKAILTCFGKPEIRPPEPRPLKSPSSTPSRSRHANSFSSTGKLSGRSIYSHTNSTSGSQFKSSIFTMEEIQKATKNFSPALKIGQGGFGTVYKGTLDDGKLVAVKRAKKTMHDSHVSVEFKSEIKIMGRVEHLNLVKFYGYLEDGDEKIIVVEYVPNGTLREHLDGFHGNYLDLGARIDIAIDVAHAVTYLHMYADHPIIHRDIKASNILLTETLRAKVADFGFARANESGVTIVSTQVKGTAGYLDPEYLKTYQLTEKSDVFSFGVLLVELISARRPIEPKRKLKDRITAKWAIEKFTQGSAIEVLDPNLLRTPATNLAVEKVLELAFQCLAPTRQGRPSMRKCAEILWDIRKDYRQLSTSYPLP